MTAIEQLSAWAQTPDDEIFVGVGYRDRPYVVSRVKARAVADGFAKMADGNAVRVEAIRGITCVIVEMPTPWAALPNCRVIVSPVAPFA